MTTLFKYLQKELIKIFLIPLATAVSFYGVGYLLYSVSRFVYVYPVVTGIIATVAPLALSVLVSYFAGVRLFRMLRENHGRALSFVVSALWYALWAIFFFSLWSGTFAAALLNAGFNKFDLMSMNYAADPYFIPLAASFFLAGVIALYFFEGRNTLLATEQSQQPHGKSTWKSIRMPILIFFIGTVTLILFRAPAARESRRAGRCGA